VWTYIGRLVVTWIHGNDRSLLITLSRQYHRTHYLMFCFDCLLQSLCCYSGILTLPLCPRRVFLTNFGSLAFLRFNNSDKAGRVMWLFVPTVILSLVLSFCEHGYCKSNHPISLKLGVMIEPMSRENWLTFGGDVVLSMNSGSLFRFPHHCGIVDFRRLAFHIQSPADFSRHSAKWLTPTR